MEVVVDFISLKGARNELVCKELSIASDGVIQTYHFKSPYPMAPHGSPETGVNWDDGHVPYGQLSTVLSEAVAGYAHLYAYGETKCAFLSDLINRTFLNLEYFKCPSAENLKPPKYQCGFPCHRFPSVRCTTRGAQCLYEWLMHHFKTMSYVKCPPDFSRHSAQFISAAL
jgi:hypothetical protein